MKSNDRSGKNVSSEDKLIPNTADKRSKDRAGVIYKDYQDITAEQDDDFEKKLIPRDGRSSTADKQGGKPIVRPVRPGDLKAPLPDDEILRKASKS